MPIPMTWNPADNYGFILKVGNMEATCLASNNLVYGVRATGGHSTGKKFFQITVYDRKDGSRFGLASPSATLTGDPSVIFGGAGLSGHIHYRCLTGNSAVIIGDTAVIAAPDINPYMTLSFAVDFDAQKVWVAINGTWLLNGNPGAGTNATYTSPSSLGTLYPAILHNSNSVISSTIGFGEFLFPPVSGRVPVGFEPWEIPTASIATRSPMGNPAALLDVYRGKVYAAALSPLAMPLIVCAQTSPSSRVVRLSAYISGGEDGVADYPIPLSSFNLSKRSGATSYYSINVPFTDALLAEIVTRPNGKIYIRRDGFPWESFNVGHPVRYAVGPRSASISISGTRQSTLASPSTVAIESRIVIDKSINSEGLLTLDLVPGFIDPRPGDTITWEGESYTVQLKKFQANTSGQTLSINAEPVV